MREPEESAVRVADSVQEGCKLVEAGFECVCDFGSIKLFRKRKRNYTLRGKSVHYVYSGIGCQEIIDTSARRTNSPAF